MLPGNCQTLTWHGRSTTAPAAPAPLGAAPRLGPRLRWLGGDVERFGQLAWQRRRGGDGGGSQGAGEGGQGGLRKPPRPGDSAWPDRHDSVRLQCCLQASHPPVALYACASATAALKLAWSLPPAYCAKPSSQSASARLDPIH